MSEIGIRDLYGKGWTGTGWETGLDVSNANGAVSRKETRTGM